MMSAMLSLRAFCEQPSFSLSVFVTFCAIVFLTILPFFFRLILWCFRGELDKPNVQYSYGTLYLNLDTQKTQETENYHMWFMLRRITFVVTIVWVTAAIPGVQIAITCAFSASVMLYLYRYKPFKEPQQNLIARGQPDQK